MKYKVNKKHGRFEQVLGLELEAENVDEARELLINMGASIYEYSSLNKTFVIVDKNQEG